MDSTTTQQPGPAKGKRNRNYPADTLEEALAVSQAIKDHSAGKPMTRILLAEAIKKSPESSAFRILLSSSNKYGLTDGSEKSAEIALTDVGLEATSEDSAQRARALRRAALTPPVFQQFYTDFDQNKLPPVDSLRKTLVAKYEVPDERALECVEILTANGRLVGIIKDLSSGSRVLLDAAPTMAPERPAEPAAGEREEVPDAGVIHDSLEPDEVPSSNGHGDRPGSATPPEARRAKGLFVGHGKNHGPLDKIEKFLVKYGIPHRIGEEEPHLGRPIPTKVKDTMKECGAAILIFTKDEEFFDKDGNSIWRPSENVIYELGAASLLYEDRIVIFMENGLHFPTNFESIGHIAFDEDQIEAKTSELFQELIGLGLIKVTVN